MQYISTSPIVDNDSTILFLYKRQYYKSQKRLDKENAISVSTMNNECTKHSSMQIIYFCCDTEKFP